MKTIEPRIEILNSIDGEKILSTIERIGRTCYKSEAKIDSESASKFVSMIIANKHDSVLEHVTISVKIICDRGISHEIVRHRIASYSQESTRYCNYSHEKFGKELTFIKPCYWESDSEEYKIWFEQMEQIENTYFKLLNNGAKPEQARAVLPNSLKTEIVATMNLREWRHFFSLRASSHAHPQMQQIAKMILTEFKEKIPLIFDEV